MMRVPSRCRHAPEKMGRGDKGQSLNIPRSEGLGFHIAVSNGQTAQHPTMGRIQLLSGGLLHGMQFEWVR